MARFEQVFWGSPWAVQLLQAHLRQGRLHHAYLLVGPPGTGRRTLALRMAQALLCPRSPEPGAWCGACASCKALERTLARGEGAGHPDVTVVQAAPGALGLQVDQIREVRSRLHRTPTLGRYRVAVLLEFGRATPAAANALLKTLEEPGEHGLLLLTATSLESVLPTVVSRCAPLPLRPMAPEELAQRLHQTHQVDLPRARQVAAWAAGRVGYARRLLEDEQTYQEHASWLEDLEHLLPASHRERFAYARELTQRLSRAHLERPLTVWAAFWRDVLHQQQRHPVPPFHPERQDLLQRLARTLSWERTYRAWKTLLQALDRLHRYVTPRLLLEGVLLTWPRVPVG